MDSALILNILRQISQNTITPEHGLPLLKQAMHPTPVSRELIPDLKREQRTGIREVIFGPGKSAEQIIEAAKRLGENNNPVLATRVSPEHEPALKKAFPQGIYHSPARIFALNFDPGLEQRRPEKGDVLVITAGSADVPVALECLATCKYMGMQTGLLCDAGVAGLHRILENRDKMDAAKALVVIAGMDGALPSVVAGLSPLPVIGVPTSVGYGAALNGFTPLLNMLNSCAPGVTTVNIDNGFGAACVAKKILNAVAGS